MNRAAFGWTERPSHSADYLVSPVLALVDRVAPKTVLDAGCGQGNLAARLADRGYQVTGVDGDPGGIEIAQRIYPQAQFRLVSFADDPPGSYDLVTSTEVIEHLYTPSELTSYAYKALRPGGTFVISTPYHGYLKNLAIALTDKWDHHHTVDHHCGHIKFFSRKTLTALLEQTGFRVTGFVGAGRYPYLWKSMILTAVKPEGAA